jgi:predicted component of type VI protein secretion system
LRRLPALAQESEFRALVGENGAAGEPMLSSSMTPVVQPGPALTNGSASGASRMQRGGADATMLEVMEPSTRAAGSSGDGAHLLQLFVETYAPDIRRTGPKEVEQFLHQLAATLESFAQAFVELSRGHEEFRTQMAVPTAADSALKRGANTGRDILRRLLDTGPEGSARVRDLTRGFADVMVHQVALLSGMREGVRALLAQLEPSAIAGDKPPANRFAAVLSRLNAFRGITAWKAYVRRYHELTEEDRAVEGVLFGPEFAYAYTRVIGGPMADKGPRARGPAAQP